MLFFLDTGSLEEIRTAAGWGLLDGVTTNPTLVSREGMDHRSLILEIARITAGPISVETTAEQAEEMVAQGREYARWAPNVYVKVPCTPEGIRAAVLLGREGVRINVTLVFSVNQAILAAKAGAAFVSPFVGRLDDIGMDGMAVVREIVQVYRAQRYGTKVLAASLRHPLHVTQAAAAGADIATMPFKVMAQLFAHPLTEIGQARFLADWRKLQDELERTKTTV
ncbi:MAG TPA: fructose-6-phosphate aldolase [bacterium]|nr:fructose-6-phosphate aldolase [bacterium]